MENFDQTFILLAQSEGISLNFDILESGLLNIIALVGILIYSGRDFLSPLLEARKNEISSSVEDAQERRDEAFLSWAIAETQLDQVTVLISEITEQTVLIKKSLKNRCRSIKERSNRSVWKSANFVSLKGTTNIS